MQYDPLFAWIWGAARAQTLGVERVSEGTIFNYLPMNIGDALNSQRVREAVHALYATGLFRDVQLRRNGNTLVVNA